MITISELSNEKNVPEEARVVEKIGRTSQLHIVQINPK